MGGLGGVCFLLFLGVVLEVISHKDVVERKRPPTGTETKIVLTTCIVLLALFFIWA